MRRRTFVGWQLFPKLCCVALTHNPPLEKPWHRSPATGKPEVQSCLIRTGSLFSANPPTDTPPAWPGGSQEMGILWRTCVTCIVMLYAITGENLLSVCYSIQHNNSGHTSYNTGQSFNGFYHSKFSKLFQMKYNKANLRDSIAATGLVILLKLDSNRRLISPCDLEIWWMTLKNSKAPLLYYIKLCASFQIHREFTLELQSGNAQYGSKLVIFFCPTWPWNLMDDLEKQ